MHSKFLSISSLMSATGVKFGTSGVRGLVSEMTEEICFAYTLAFLNTLNLQAGSKVAIGMDLRPSSPEIVCACASAIQHAGHEVIFCGALPTPALAYYAQESRLPAIMVTGSHIPFDRNGIKFYGLAGEITKSDEQRITQSNIDIPEALPSNTLPAESPEAVELYINRYLDFFPSQCLKGKRIGVYEHSSVARDVLRKILEALGAEVLSLGRTDTFVPIDTEAVSEADVEMAKAWGRESKFDAIFSTDGDGDRPLIGDEQGRWLRGDIVGILTAQYLAATAVITPVSSNTALELCGAFASTVRTRIGSPYVIAAMEELIAQNNANVVGFEANGGFLLGSRANRDGRTLMQLMTRDAVLPMLAIVALAQEKQCNVSQLANALPSRFTSSDRLQAFPTETSQQIIQQLSTDNAAIEALLGNVCGKPVKTDLTDGIRISFENGEIIHFRPSGNAPELRCYAEASSQTRADKLPQKCLQLLKTSYGV